MTLLCFEDSAAGGATVYGSVGGVGLRAVAFEKKRFIEIIAASRKTHLLNTFFDKKIYEIFFEETVAFWFSP